MTSTESRVIAPEFDETNPNDQPDEVHYTVIRRRAGECPHVRDRMLGLLAMLDRPLPAGFTLEVCYSPWTNGDGAYPDGVIVYLEAIVPDPHPERRSGGARCSRPAGCTMSLWVPTDPTEAENVTLYDPPTARDYFAMGFAPDDLSDALAFFHRFQWEVMAVAQTLGILPGPTSGIELLADV